MGIVFDEVVGSVEPSSAPQPEEKKNKTETAAREPDLEKLRHEINRLEQRNTRLQAD